MKKLSFKLLSATILAGAMSTGAQAQFAFPSAEIRGNGASSVQNVVVNVLDCVGEDNPLGLSNGNNTQPVTLGTYTGTNPLTCTGSGASNAGNIYDSTGVFDGKYISTGSGLGREEWRLFTNRFDGTPGKIFPTTFAAQNAGNPWPHIQYAFSDAAASASDISAYNTNANSATNKAGAAIQFPLFVFPVAFAYNPVYGFKSGAPLSFNITKSQKLTTATAGGLKLTTENYCDIWNGTIINWNDGALVENTGGHSLKAAADDLTRWNTFGVPIRLVGRADKSGTTDLLSHALKAQCAARSGNKFLRSAESLPFDSTGPLDFTAFRSDTNYKPGVASTNFAGTTQSLGGLVYDRKGAAHGFCQIGSVTASDCSTFPVNPNTPGLFIVADGSGGVSEAVNTVNVPSGSFTVTNALLTGAAVTGDDNVTLNGKFGYISADFITPAPGAVLFAAALQQTPNSVITTKTKFLMPGTKNAAAAFGKVLPPQTKSAKGTFDVTDTRTVCADITAATCGTPVAVDRSNPLHWVNILYPPSGTTLESPALGYPVTGPSNMLTYTCFDSDGKRSAIANFVGYLLAGGLAKDTVALPLKLRNSNTALNTLTFTGTSNSALGILTKSNVGIVPAAWGHAITETFLKNSAETKNGQVLGAKNLWIQSQQPTTSINDATSNPTCTAGSGA